MCNSLHSLTTHDLHNLMRTALVQASPGVALPNVRLNVEVRGGQSRFGLFRERRQRRVVTESREHRPDWVGDEGDEHSAVTECHCRPRRLVSRCPHEGAQEDETERASNAHITSNAERANTDNQKYIRFEGDLSLGDGCCGGVLPLPLAQGNSLCTPPPRAPSASGVQHRARQSVQTSPSPALCFRPCRFHLEHSGT